MLSETLRSRWFSGCVHAALWLLLLLVVTRAGGRRPPFEEAPPNPAAVTSPVPVARLENLVAADQAGRSDLPATKDHPWAAGRNPFDTTWFIPQTKPPPPAPTTRKIELTYQGFYQIGDGSRHAMIRFGNTLASVPVGATVATNVFVADVTTANLTLTNAAGQTNTLAVNAKKEIEIPIH